MAVAESLVTPAPVRLMRTENQSSSVARKATRSPRRIFSEDQKREVARLYAETTTSVPDIMQQFGIAQASLYRLIQQRGVAPRGRLSAATRSETDSARPRTARKGALAPSQQTSSVNPSSGSGLSYRVSFAALRIIRAVDIRDAIRQAEELGATEISAIVRAE
jgi:transposase-like protein